jgi:hypothetical protein
MGMGITDSELAVIRGIISNTLISRPTFYAIPELSNVANNRGDRINKKLQQVLKSMAAGVGAEGMVAEELAKLGRTKKAPGGGAGRGRASPATSKSKKQDRVKDEILVDVERKKEKAKGSAVRGKKRKVKDEQGGDIEWNAML